MAKMAKIQPESAREWDALLNDMTEKVIKHGRVQVQWVNIEDAPPVMHCKCRSHKRFNSP